MINHAKFTHLQIIYFLWMQIMVNPLTSAFHKIFSFGTCNMAIKFHFCLRHNSFILKTNKSCNIPINECLGSSDRCNLAIEYKQITSYKCIHVQTTQLTEIKSLRTSSAASQPIYHLP